MNRGRLLLLLPPLLGALVLAACVGTRHPAGASATVRAGEAVYRGECARCHGPRGEGVAGKYDEALHGEQSVDALARYIARTMPEDRPGTLAPEESRAVAEFIHGAFYAPTARARNHPARVEPARLTNRQYRESLADLLGSFRPVRHARTPGGLEAEYFQSKGMNKKEKSILQRRDRGIDFDFADGSPAAGITADQFSIAWAGSLLVRETGEYQFRLTTPNGARLYLNTDLAAGDANRRDDSDAKRQPALIDLWVSSGGQIREGAATLFLLGGRSYPLRVDYFKFKEKTAAVRLEWKPPHGVWSVIPASALSPEPSSAVAVIGTALPADD
ncbi:MAG: PA14 domain-containing protein, partial [Verrucomicrobiota bacterium]